MIRKLICLGDQRLTAGWIVCFAIGAVSTSRIAAADEPVRDPEALIGSAGITPAGGRVYVTTADGTITCFAAGQDKGSK